MPNSEMDLEKAWKEWKRAKAKGLVKGDFLRAEELLEKRKSEAKSLSGHIPFQLELKKRPDRWPSRPKGHKSRR